MTTEERLENLERELARAKRRNRWLLAGLGLCLGALVVVWALGWNTPGRYVLSGAGGGAYVLDTKTSRLWVRGPEIKMYLGTNEQPKKEFLKNE